MKKSINFAKNPGSLVPLPPQPVSTAPLAFNAQEDAIIAAMGAIAAVIEEPYCAVGGNELKNLVRAFRKLSRAVGFKRHDYALVNGCAVLEINRATVLKRPVKVSQ